VKRQVRRIVPANVSATMAEIWPDATVARARLSE
jgi:hypothetical protein